MLKGSTNEEKIWNFLLEKMKNPYGVAGLMGNLFAESSLRPNNLISTFNSKLGMSDEEYTQSVDSGTYTKFVSDSAGYGLAQWTFSSRKQDLLNYAKEHNKSIGDLEMQLNFLWLEIQKYKTVINTLLTADNLKDASNIVLTRYERPVNQSVAVQNKRISYCKKYFDKYAEVKHEPVVIPPEESPTEPKQVRAKTSPNTFDSSFKGTYVTTSKLYCRNGAGKNFSALCLIPKGTKVHNYGYFTIHNNDVWLFIQFILKDTKYTGFSMINWLEKVQS